MFQVECLLSGGSLSAFKPRSHCHPGTKHCSQLHTYDVDCLIVTALLYTVAGDLVQKDYPRSEQVACDIRHLTPAMDCPLLCCVPDNVDCLIVTALLYNGGW